MKAYPTHHGFASGTYAVRVRAFGSKSPTRQIVYVDGETVRAWDPVAGYYSTCHSISQRDQARIIAAIATQAARVSVPG